MASSSSSNFMIAEWWSGAITERPSNPLQGARCPLQWRLFSSGICCIPGEGHRALPHEWTAWYCGQSFCSATCTGQGRHALNADSRLFNSVRSTFRLTVRCRHCREGADKGNYLNKVERGRERKSSGCIPPSPTINARCGLNCLQKTSRPFEVFSSLLFISRATITPFFRRMKSTSIFRSLQ